MAVASQFLQQLQVFLPQARVDITTLALFYQEAFGVPLNTRCNLCITDGIKALQKFLQQHTLQQQTQHTMEKFKWTTDTRYADVKVTMRVGGKLKTIHAGNLTEHNAEVLRNSAKYMHLIEEIGTPGELTAKSETTALPTSEATTSTLILQPSGVKTAKPRKKKQPSA